MSQSSNLRCSLGRIIIRFSMCDGIADTPHQMSTSHFAYICKISIHHRHIHIMLTSNINIKCEAYVSKSVTFLFSIIKNVFN